MLFAVLVVFSGKKSWGDAQASRFSGGGAHKPPILLNLSHTLVKCFTEFCKYGGLAKRFTTHPPVLGVWEVRGVCLDPVGRVPTEH
jgi:hypothetical protein